jgi:hypothetical protein
MESTYMTTASKWLRERKKVTNCLANLIIAIGMSASSTACHRIVKKILINERKETGVEECKPVI